jgi:hypothetical protein
MDKKSIAVIRKRRGRPPTGQDPVTALRLAPALRSSIEKWAKQQPDWPTRSEAIRRLIEFALAVQGKKKLQAPSLTITDRRDQTKIPMQKAGSTLIRNRNENMIFSPVQCRMGRAALGLRVRELATGAKVSVDTVARFERGDELKERTIEALRRALEAAGVEFTNGDQPGVRLTTAAVVTPPEHPGAPTRTRTTARGKTERKS